MLDQVRIRADFPILSREVNGRPLIYLDSAATAQKPNQVIDAVANYYRTSNANVHRGVHTLGDEATEAYEQARRRVARFINGDAAEIVFVRNTTEAINLVAQTWAAATIGPGDEVVVGSHEHHSNLVPWQRLCQQRGATLQYLPLDDDQAIASLDTIGPRTRLVAIGHVSNAFGTISPLEQIVAAAKRVGARVLVDGAQSAPHLPVDVRALGIDFFAFSGHKMCGPMGIGVLWVRSELLASMEPFLVGGGMVENVTYDETSFARDASRFEAGTPNVADAVGLAAAIDYLDAIGMDAIRAHERDLIEHGLAVLGELEGVRVFGPRDPERQSGVLSFTVEGVHPHDIGTVLDHAGIAIRAGKHCCHPAMACLGIPGTARASVYLYNTHDELDRLAEEIVRAGTILGSPIERRNRFCQ